MTRVTRVYSKNTIMENLAVYKDNFNLQDPNKIWIFHHTDADGYCGGFICKIATRPHLSETHACDYTTDFSKYPIEKDDVVILVDLSFTSSTAHYLKEMAYKCNNKIIWIDHHESSLDLCNNDEDLRNIDFMVIALGTKENKFSAAFLAYAAFYYNLNKKNGHDEIDIPEFVYLVSDWDTWSQKTKDSKYFNKAVNSTTDIYLYNREIGGYNKDNIWEKLYREYICHSDQLLVKMINEARPLVKQTETLDARYLNSNGFEFNLFGYKVLACNQKSNSLLFGDKINEYDFVCPFVLHERNGKLIYTYSLFSGTNQNCKEMAERFGGGGHRGAAGFQLPFNIFTVKNLKLRLFLHNLKNKLSTK